MIYGFISMFICGIFAIFIIRDNYITIPNLLNVIIWGGHTFMAIRLFSKYDYKILEEKYKSEVLK